jgi:hypothetical protein
LHLVSVGIGKEKFRPRQDLNQLKFLGPKACLFKELPGRCGPGLFPYIEMTPGNPQVLVSALNGAVFLPAY